MNKSTVASAINITQHCSQHPQYVTRNSVIQPPKPLIESFPIHAVNSSTPAKTPPSYPTLWSMYWITSRLMYSNACLFMHTSNVWNGLLMHGLVYATVGGVLACVLTAPFKPLDRNGFMDRQDVCACVCVVCKHIDVYIDGIHEHINTHARKHSIMSPSVWTLCVHM